MHRDIKPDNILVDENDDFLLCDYGLMRNLKLKSGTPLFYAPEQFERDRHTDIPLSDAKAMDMYGIGITAYCLAMDMPSSEELKKLDIRKKNYSCTHDLTKVPNGIVRHLI